MKIAKNISIERWVMATIASGFFAIFIAVAMAAFTSSWLVCSLTGLVFLLICSPVIASRLPKDFDGIAQKRWLMSLLWVALSIAALVRVGGVAVYMANAEQPQASAMWFDNFYVNHSCLSAYWKASEVAFEGGKNIYSSEVYAGHEGRFKLDEYLYPPQFLILPFIGSALGADFLQMRALWFALDAAMIAFVMLALCIWIGGRAGRGAALLSPAVWLAVPTLITLQTGNFQLVAIAMALLAMLMFEKQKTILGGALLGFAALKIFPGVLCAYLLFSKRWQALGWTVAAVAVYSLISLAIFGFKPFEDFLFYELPRIASGEVWAWLQIDGLQGVVAINHSVPGLVLKLQVAGVDGMDMQVMSAVAWIWSLVVIAVAWLAATKIKITSRLQQVEIWIVLLSLAALRSPFVPDDYALFPALWLLSFVAGSMWNTLPRMLTLTGLWIAFSIVIPFSLADATDIPAMLIVSTTSQLLALGLCFWVLSGRQYSIYELPEPEVKENDSNSNIPAAAVGM